MDYSNTSSNPRPLVRVDLDTLAKIRQMAAEDDRNMLQTLRVLVNRAWNERQAASAASTTTMTATPVRQ